jgi:hypothetical protein
LEKEEQRYWKEYSKYKRELLMAEDDFRSLDCQVNGSSNPEMPKHCYQFRFTHSFTSIQSTH